jgi:dTDP-glucose 4,6-dehydratase
MQQQRKPRNILVTGGAGFIGSAFVRYLLQKTAFTGTCVNLDLLTYAGNLANLASLAEDSRHIFHQGDICNQALVEHLCFEYQIDTLIHFAAESHVDRSIHAPHTFLQTNVMGTFYLLEAARKFPSLHFHHVSTDEVYGCLGDTGVFTEETPYRPNSPYSASKAASDHFVRAYGKTYNLSTCISNCSNNYGPYQFPEKLIPLMILNCMQNKPLPIYGNGSNVRDWLYVEDHAEALWLLLQYGKSGEVYNVGGRAERSNLELVHALIQLIAEKQNVPINSLQDLITYVKDRPGHDFRYAIDATKMQRNFHWQPRHTFADGLKKTVTWYHDHLEWTEAVTSGEYRNWLTKNYQTIQSLIPENNNF